jgi:hypothetical protein
MLVRLVARMPRPPAPSKRPRGRPNTSSDRLILKGLVIMIVRGVYTASAWLAVLDQADAVSAPWRVLLCENGPFPSRRTWDRRLEKRPDQRPGLIGCLGRALLELIQPFAHAGRAAAMASTALRTGGGVWHKNHPDKGEIPHTSIDTEAGWRQSGWPGWWYGWKRHRAVAVGSVWIPLAAYLTLANTDDATLAPLLLAPRPTLVRFILGDSHYNDPTLRTECERDNRLLVATRRGKHPSTDDGLEVRRIFHQLCAQAIEPFNNLFKAVFSWHSQMPVKGLRRSQRLALAAIFVSQLVLLSQHEHHRPVGKAIKAFLRAA